MSPRDSLMKYLRRLTLCAAAGLAAAAPLEGQEQPQAVDKDTLQTLLKRIDQLEGERKEVPAEAAQGLTVASAPMPIAGMDGATTPNCGPQNGAKLSAGT